MRHFLRTGLCLGVTFGLAGFSQAALVGHWAMDEHTSGTATGANSILDSSGGGHNATPNGGVTYTTGQVGAGALTFDGSTGYVQVNGSHGTALDMAGSQYTIAWWEKVNSINTGTLNVPLGNDDGQDFSDGVLVYFDQGGNLLLAQNTHTGTPNQTAGTGYNVNTAGDLGKWVHFALVYDSGTDSRNLYINGTFFSYIQTFNNAGSNGTTDLYFGRYTVNNGHYFNGSLDDIRIYDTALTAGEIAQLAVVPEPASALLLVGGLGALALRRRRA